MNTSDTIEFECTGFSSTQVFLVRDGRQYSIGYLTKRGGTESFEFTPMWLGRQLSEADIPKEESVIKAYNQKYTEKGVWINDQIRYAG